MFPSWWLAISSGRVCCLCQTFYVYWTPAAGKNVRQGLSSLSDISRRLLDMSGIFCDHWAFLPLRMMVVKRLLSPPVHTAQWAHMHRFLSVCLSVRLWLYKNSWTIIHISKSSAPRVMKFGQIMDVHDAKVDLEGQGHRSKIKVTRSKNVISGLIWPSYM